MKDLEQLAFADLVDLLAEQSRLHIHLLKKGGNQETINRSMEFLVKIQNEIIFRINQDKKPGMKKKPKNRIAAQ